MHYEVTLKATVAGLYENELLVSLFHNGQGGSYISRESVEQIHHSSQSVISHPDIPWLCANTNGHVYLSGQFGFQWDMEMSHDEMQKYIDIVDEDLSGTGIVHSFFKGNNRLTMTMNVSGFSSPDWCGKPMQWIPSSSSAKITFQTNECEVLCASRTNNSYGKWTFEQRTIEPNEAAVIDRPDSDVCYVIASDDIGPLLAKKMYKLTSNSISLSGADKRVRVMRYYK